MNASSVCVVLHWRYLQQQGRESNDLMQLRVASPLLSQLWATQPLLAAIPRRLHCSTNDSENTQSKPSNSRLPPASATNTATPAKSFKEAVSSPASLPSPSLTATTLLLPAELSLKEYKQKFWETNRKAEALDRQGRQLNLLVCNVLETAEQHDSGRDAFLSLLDKS